MKRMMIFLVVVFTFCNLKAQEERQEINQLDEAKVTYKYTVNVTGNLGDGKIDVKENYKGQFHGDPLKFCDEKFDILGLIESVDSDGYEWFEVTFKSRKGYIIATYDPKGELLRTSQKFKDIALPNNLLQKLFRDYEGWTMINNKYLASSKGNMIHNAKYRIVMRKGNTTEIVKIDPFEISRGSISSN